MAEPSVEVVEVPAWTRLYDRARRHGDRVGPSRVGVLAVPLSLPRRSDPAVYTEGWVAVRLPVAAGPPLDAWYEVPGGPTPPLRGRVVVASGELVTAVGPVPIRCRPVFLGWSGAHARPDTALVDDVLLYGTFRPDGGACAEPWSAPPGFEVLAPRDEGAAALAGLVAEGAELHARAEGGACRSLGRVDGQHLVVVAGEETVLRGLSVDGARVLIDDSFARITPTGRSTLLAPTGGTSLELAEPIEGGAAFVDLYQWWEGSGPLLAVPVGTPRIGLFTSDAACRAAVDLGPVPPMTGER